MVKTIVVQVGRLVRHPTYGRVMRLSTAFKAHDERNEAAIGDEVKIMETRPLSKEKRWRLVEILKRASSAPPVPGGESHASEPAPRAMQGAGDSPSTSLRTGGQGGEETRAGTPEAAG
jgi:small subunit ribosomal protein S17